MPFCGACSFGFTANRCCAALSHLEHFRKVAASLGSGAAGQEHVSITEWRALMPPKSEEEPLIDDEHGTD